MKIIKKGTQETKKDQFYKGRCPSCNSEFVFEDKEITLYKFLNNNNGRRGYINCPCCHNQIYIYNNFNSINTDISNHNPCIQTITEEMYRNYMNDEERCE